MKMRNQLQAELWFYFGLLGVTSIFWSPLFDPFNSPKSWILGITGVWLLFWLILYSKSIWEEKTLKKFTISSGIYLGLLLISFLFTKNKFVGFFGEYGRRNGLLTYIFLVVFMISAALLVRFSNIRKIQIIIIFLGFINSLYGILQYKNIDFAKWKNPFNPIVTTFGNPDYASACMAIFAIICFGLAFFSENSKFAKLIFFFVFLLLLTTVYLTQAKQGLIMIALGLTTICLVWSSKFKSKIPLLAGSGISFIIGSFSILGMLNIGPLSRYLYKSSVSYRGDYWRIALRMIREHPFAGVGLDSYGIFFRNYRDLKQIGRRGPDLISNAAHNIPLQLASTGGILLALSYICLNLFILFKAIQKIRNLQGNPRLILATFFAAWLAYQAQSLISIDNLAIAIWGYVLGGVIIGLSIDERPGFKISPPKIYQPLVSSFFAILAILLFSFLYKSEHAMLVLSQTQVPKVDAQFSKYETIAMAPLSHTFIEPTFAFNVADDLAQISRFDTAIQIIKKEISKDPNNFGGNNLLAHIYEFRHEWGKAIELRKLNVKLDPFNYKNMYQLVIDFVAQSKLNDAQKYSAKIIKIAPSSEEAAKVKTLWTNK